MSWFSHAVELFLHLDQHLGALAGEWGEWTLVGLIVVVFCETGLVVTPFLPGDSLLFAAGALAAQGFYGVSELLVGLSLAAILGDSVNYALGAWVGPRVFEPGSRVFKRAYIERTQAFFEKYGAKTIILARFVPIVRTFAPFLAGVGSMRYRRFAVYNVVGGVLWVSSLSLAGYFFADIPVVKSNFSIVVLAIIGISLLPVFIEFAKARRSGSAGAA